MSQEKQQKPENADRTLTLGLYLLFGLTVIAIGLFHGNLLTVTLQRLESTINELDFWGPLLLTLVASLWAIFCLPGPIILGFIGTLYSHDPHIGIAIAVAADTVAEIVGFLVARHLGREQVIQWLGKKPWFQWLEEQVEQRGAYGVFVVRMMPFFPNSLANYAFGLSALRFWPYLIASVLGSIPNLALYIGGTAGVVHLVRHGFKTESNYAIAAGALVLTVLLLLGLQALLRRQAAKGDKTSKT